MPAPGVNGGAYPAAHAALLPVLQRAGTLEELPPLTLVRTGTAVVPSGEGHATVATSHWVAAAVTVDVVGPYPDGSTLVDITNLGWAPVLALDTVLAPGGALSRVYG